MRHASGDVPAIRLELDNEWAWCGARRLELSPRLFGLLRYLVEHPRRLITKDELLAAVWEGTAVSEAALTSCVRDLRRALADSSHAPRYVETVHRRGFRFIGPIAPPASPPSPPQHAPAVTPLPSTPLVGREAELARLHALFAAAAAGGRRLVFVTGEAGIGKTALVEAFLAQLGGIAGLRIGRGQCVEQYGAGEAYLPVLEALGRMGREPPGDAFVRILTRYAPTWLAQLPALLTDEELDAVQRRLHGATRERMLRELVEAFDALSLEAPLVLVLEDLHWSDAATIDLLATCARRPDPARLLIVGTYRPAEALGGHHPLAPVKQELQVHGQCDELALDFLSEAATAQFLDWRFPRASFSADFARVLHESTGGNPLFLVNVVDDLVAQDQLREVDGRWQLSVPLERVASDVPRTLWQLIEKHVERLSPLERAVLAVASVAGAEFSAALLTVDGTSADDAERCCDRLARRGLFLRATGVAQWPDGTVAGRYAFIHALYRNVLYAGISIGHRVGLHLRIGARLERAHGADADTIAGELAMRFGHMRTDARPQGATRGYAGEVPGELAMHFEHGRDFERAVHYRRQAADAALRQTACREAVEHATRALELLAALPESSGRNRQELMIQTVLGAAVIATNGWADPAVARAYARARELCADMAPTPELFPFLVGLSGFYIMRGDVPVAHELSRRLLALAEATQDPAALLGAHNTAGMTMFYRGEFVAALGHLERAKALYDPERHSPNRRAFAVDYDPGVLCAAHTAMTCMMLGHQDRAAASMRECLAYARSLDHPLSLALAFNYATTFHQYRREPQAVRELEAMRAECAQTYDFEMFVMLGEIYRGWLLTEEGRVEEGAARIEHGLAVYQAVGAELGTPTFLGILADVYARLGRRTDAVSVIDGAIALAERTGLHYWDAELRRVKGVLLMRADAAPSRARGRLGDGTADRDAESLLLEAIEIARAQEAKSVELRAAIALSRLWQRRRETRRARALLAEVYRWFTEGFETPDSIDARALLEQLGGRP